MFWNIDVASLIKEVQEFFNDPNIPQEVKDKLPTIKKLMEEHIK